jgi:hypothetical protein
MKLGRRSRWIIILVILLAAVTVLFTQVDSVQATFTNMHAFTVLFRVETEIMQKTPAGQYYESLFWKHNDELMQIHSNSPESSRELMRVTRMFVPGLEALLNGEGDTVQITVEQVESLKAQLDWYASVGGSALREDIQRELQRTPLNAFVGMTMGEALDFINSNWSADSIVEQTLVPDSNGIWAYYVHNGVYMEYPASYLLQISCSKEDYIYFIPNSGMPEQWNAGVMKVRLLNVPTQGKNSEDPHSWYTAEYIKWDKAIHTEQFDGSEFIAVPSNDPPIILHAFLYNEQNQIAVVIWALVHENPQIADASEYLELVHQRYEYFQHMVDSIKLDPSSISELPVQQTPTPDLGLQLTPTPYVVVDQTLVPVPAP